MVWDASERCRKEREIEARLAGEDVNSVYSLMNSEKSMEFAAGIAPYYGVTVKNCSWLFRIPFADGDMFRGIRDICDTIDVYGRRREVDVQDYITEDGHIVGNSYMAAVNTGSGSTDPYDIESSTTELGVTLCAMIVFMKDKVDKVYGEGTVKRRMSNVTIDTGKHDDKVSRIEANLNFLKYVVRPLFEEDNKWLFRMEYIACLYTYRLLKHDKTLDTEFFRHSFTEYMIGYKVEGKGLITEEYIDRPFYGIVENCYDGMPFSDMRRKLTECVDRLLDICRRMEK